MAGNLSSSHPSPIERLTTLIGADPAFYVLAVHSYIEQFVDQADSEAREYPYYTDKLACYFRNLGDSAGAGGATGRMQQIRTRLCGEHSVTNLIRHQFRALSIEEARAATHNLLAFCEVSGTAESDELAVLKERLYAWRERKSSVEVLSAFDELSARMEKVAGERNALAEEIEALRASTLGKELAQRELDRVIAELESLRTKTSKNDGRIAELRKERFQLRETVRELQREIDSRPDAASYLSDLTQFLAYTRTRLDFERELVRLTPEQEEVLAQITLSHDFLIKGSAGTGKTLVLLKALEKAIAEAATQPELLPQSPTRPRYTLITYTNTLAKYDTYLASLIGAGSAETEISTVYQFLESAVHCVCPDYRLDYNAAKSAIEGTDLPEGVDKAVAVREVDGFLFGNQVAREAYIDERMPRRGMGVPMRLPIREKMWELAEHVAATMEAAGTFTANYAAKMLADGTWDVALTASEEWQPPEIVFVDEVQDLPAVQVAAIKGLSTRLAILAGDSNQAIYEPGFSFRAAGVAASGHTRVLRTNFRNSVEIAEFAERYRRAAGDPDPDTSDTRAFRHGPPPELFRCTDKNEAKTRIVGQLDLLTGVLGYEESTIGILCPFKAEVDDLASILTGHGYGVSRVQDREFDFDSQNGVRLCTIHSSKGLDFPVVLLYLPRRPFAAREFADDVRDQMARNLIYVAATRAMEYLGIFILEDPATEAIADLVKAAQTTDLAASAPGSEKEA